MYDIIIIGAGPSGLTASIYASMSNKKTLVLEEKYFGGQIINSNEIDNYPGLYKVSGFDFIEKLTNQAQDLGSEFKFEEVIEVIDKQKYKIVKTTKNKYQTKTIIIATGQKRRKLNLPQEDKLLGKGISYCGTCDGNFYKNKVVGVVGAGNSAFEDALYLSNICKEVYLIHRNTNFKANNRLIKNLKEKENVKFILNSNITKLIGNNKLEEIILNDKNKLKLDGLFIAIGEVPNTKNFKLEKNKQGYIITDENCHTSVPGIYASGDVREKSLRQLVTATNDGAICVNEALKYITNY